ncbi:hypothetical protein P154DRAFT_524545 [Amniculicola lignicola CBS 123094]|uniref:Uncharacterized protein n=1 Tax=Amniculicola lignicola CBS 123094 TaxID=1392246 RepID=A0A6A5W9M5_9PLEO|nr:hypothetical protein P154DRAFT_524545 [Amniculicola lignicola CBS 123094]
MSDARRMIRERKDAIDKDTVDAYTKRIERERTLRRRRQQIERGDGDRTGSDSDSNVGSPPPNIMDIY